MFGCASSGTGLTDTDREAMSNLILQTLPEAASCEGIDHMYKDISSAPSEVTVGTSPGVVEIWTLKGCEDAKRKRVLIYGAGPKRGVAEVDEY